MKADSSFRCVSERVSLPSLQGQQAWALPLPEQYGQSPLLSEVRGGKKNNPLSSPRGRIGCLGRCAQLRAPRPPRRQESTSGGKRESRSWMPEVEWTVGAGEERLPPVGSGGVGGGGFWPKEKRG